MRFTGGAGVAMALAASLSLFGLQPAFAAGVPQAPGYSRATLQVVVDNDYAAFMGDASNVTRLLNQNNVPWMTQISEAASLDIFPQSGESYVYLAVMGGGGTEDFGGKLNGNDIIDLPGAQVATGRSPLGSGSFSSPYMMLQGFVPGYATSEVANGTQNVTVAQLQNALTGISWSSAVSTGAGGGNVPNHKTSGVCCSGGNGLSGKGWNFPSVSLVVFRYPVTSLGLPVRAGDSQATVDWEVPAAGDAPTSYVVQYKKSSEPDSAYITFSNPVAPITEETVTGLSNGITYSFRVAGINSYGTGSYSAVREATLVGPPPPPTNLVATPKASAIEISFTNPISDGGSVITNYQYSLNSGSTWTSLSPVDVTSPVTIPGLTDGISSTILLRAVNSYGSGRASAAVSDIPGLVARLSNLTFSNNPEKGVLTTITVSLSIAGKLNFLTNGKRIPGCYKKSSTGSLPNITGTCSWKPAVMGRNVITVQGVANDNSYASSTLTSPSINVLRRITRR
jgi:hypothetical protein